MATLLFVWAGVAFAQESGLTSPKVAVIDMRRPDEQERRPDRLPQGAELLNLDVFADGEDSVLFVGQHQVLNGEQPTESATELIVSSDKGSSQPVKKRRPPPRPGRNVGVRSPSG